MGFFSEFAAVSLNHLGENNDNEKAGRKTLDDATTSFLMNNKSPSRKVNELDNRGSHFYLAMWAKELKEQAENTELSSTFEKVYESMITSIIINELNDAQGSPIDLKGYLPNDTLASEQMKRVKRLIRLLILYKGLFDSLFKYSF